jgi:hypothetical protein
MLPRGKQTEDAVSQRVGAVIAFHADHMLLGAFIGSPSFCTIRRGSNESFVLGRCRAGPRLESLRYLVAMKRTLVRLDEQGFRPLEG